jgi:hypothetical protein
MIIYKGPKVDFPTIATAQRMMAMRKPYTGHGENLDSLRFYIAPLKALCLFSLDTGYHTSGWWKNPDYETCWHLSVSYQDMDSGDVGPQDIKTSWRIVRAFYETHYKWVWTEPPFSKDGKKYDVWHYRLFIDKATGLAIFPREEVYSRELTEKGWKSFSEVQALLHEVETSVIVGKVEE